MFWEGDVPAGLTVQAGAGAFGRKEIVVVRGVQLHSEPPLLQIVQASDIASLCFRFVEGRENQRHENGNDRDGDEQFDETEAARD